MKRDTSRGDAMVTEYFRQETARLAGTCLQDVRTLDDWLTRRETYRQQLFDMLGLDPLPERTDLKATVTGHVEHDDFVVENLHFQSRPGLYVTGNLYIPTNLDNPAPTILYVCGHGRVKVDGVSYGNKVHYQHHGEWFARNGYVCLTIDTLQLGEIEGIHHGTYREGMWWWNSRGYTPAGVEAWNCIRALDYLQSRPEVDGERIGVTGRSGGGAYSWWIAALDDRIKAAVPVAGITDLTNHVVDGCVEGHCDCMYLVNTYGWDYGLVAALVAPRPLLLSNSDKDRIFPLDGVQRIHWQLRKIYDLYDASDHLGLQITEGPHSDTQELRVHAFHWFNRFLKGENPLIELTATPFFEPAQLRVFSDLPSDEINTSVHEVFTRLAPAPPLPDTRLRWARQRQQWMDALVDQSFRGWPKVAPPLAGKDAFSVEGDGLRFQAYDFTSQGPFRLRLYVLRLANDMSPRAVELNVLDESGWARMLAAMRAAGFGEILQEEAPAEPDSEALAELTERIRSNNVAIAFVAPRGVGPTAWFNDERKQVQIRRRFMLLGQTLDGMRVWDVRQAVRAIRGHRELGAARIALRGEGVMAGLALYASLFDAPVARLDLVDLPTSHREGPTFLNVLRVLDMPAAVAMAAERASVQVTTSDLANWEYPAAVARRLSWRDRRLKIVSSRAPVGH